MFILVSSVCKSLQCLNFTLTQGGEGGHLFRLTCSAVLWGERNTTNNVTGMCGECSQCMDHTRFAPAYRECAFPVYSAQAPGCSAGELSKVGPGLHALSRSKLIKFRLSGTPQWHRLIWAFVLCPSQIQGVQANSCLANTLSQVCGSSYHLSGPSCSVSWVYCKNTVSGVPCVSSGGLMSGCDPPGICQPSRIPGRLC